MMPEVQGYYLFFEIQYLPKPPNRLLTAHWSAAYKEKKKVLHLVNLSTIGKRPKEPLEKATLYLARHSSRAPDYDGMTGSFKYVIDALVSLKILKNDNMEVIGSPIYQWVKAKQKEGKITVCVKN
jgi:hypothetical protein